MKRILVIEDNLEVRENIAEILELSNYEVDTAENGKIGVEKALASPPDLILCDVMMPELDGFGVLNLLSQNTLTAGIPFIFTTARTEKEDIRRGMNLGADDYITKPFYKDELLSVIQTRLKKAKYYRQNTEDLHLSDPERGMSRLFTAFNEEGRRKIYGLGQLIVREGEHPHFIYRVNEGRVHLNRPHNYGRDYIIAEIGPGEIFGVSTLLERVPFHYNARVASAECDCQLLSSKAVMRLINSDRTITETLMYLMAKRVVEHSDRLAYQAYDSVRRRTALILCDLHEKYGDSEIDLSREELAQMVGTTKESVTRSLTDFKKEGLLSTVGRAIKVHKPTVMRGLLV